MDVAALAAGMQAIKTGFDTLRTALGLVKDVQGVMPAGEKKETVAVSLAEATKQLKFVEAQIAQGLGHQLCRCIFPPAPMLEVGEQYSITEERMLIYECPLCNRNTGGPHEGEWKRTVAHVP
jgi:hypothetical protein